MNNKLRRNERGLGYPSLVNRFFDDDFFSHFVGSDLPAVNVKESKKEYKLEISAPGFEKEDVVIQVDNNVMKITAKKESNKEEQGEEEKVLRREFVSSSFARVFTLPDNVDTEKIEAKEKNGVLTIKLPKNEKAIEDRVKRIEIR